MAVVVAGIDTGGTFTDMVAVQLGPDFVVAGSWVYKLPSTPSDPGQAVLQAVGWLQQRCDPDAELHIVHGTTVATNALLEKKGARVLWVTNEGFGDLLTLGRQARTSLYSLSPAEHPFVPDGVLEVPARLNADGHVLLPLDHKELAARLDALPLKQFDIAAVCCLYSFLNPADEISVASMLTDRGLQASCSHEVLPEPREFERGMTTFANAYVMPAIDRHLQGIEAGLPAGASLHVMQSNGGITNTQMLRREAVRTALSGPAGGVAGLATLADRAGLHQLVAFDMGGTSTDVAVYDGAPCMRDEIVVGEFVLRQRMIDIHTIGAGGGSIARVDVAGVLQVGPDSAGADPGPASYGNGGPCTVTDANLVLGRIPADSFRVCDRQLDVQAAQQTVAGLAKEMGLSSLTVAEGIVRIAESAMEKAIRRMTIERGVDPRAFVLVPYGGGGGIHAVSLARAIGMKRVLIPPHAGVFSAVGMLQAPLRVDRVKGYLRSHPAYELLCADAAAMEEAILAELGVSEANSLHVDCRLEVRYAGQSECLEVPLEEDYAACFQKEHARRYGFVLPATVEVARLLVAVEQTSNMPRTVHEPARAGNSEYPASKVYSGGAWLQDVPQFARADLEVDAVVSGPAVIREYSTCIWLPPGADCIVLPDGSLLVEVEA